MKTSTLKIIQIIALTISIIVTVLATLRCMLWEIDSGKLLFIGWAVSPYIFVWTVNVLLDMFTSLPKKSLIFCVTAVLMFAFTLLAYVGTLGDKSSTYALIFIFVPFYLYIGSIIFLAIGLIIAKLIDWQEANLINK